MIKNLKNPPYREQGKWVKKAFARDCGIPAFDEDMRPIETENVLEEADRITSRARNNTYGPPEQDFARTAAMWTGLLQYKLRNGESIRPQDVAWMMIMLKASRARLTALVGRPHPAGAETTTRGRRQTE